MVTTDRTPPGLLHDEPMARHTTWRVGGPADLFCRPGSLAELQDFLAGLPAGVPIWFVGLGSNLLVRDGGLRGAVVMTGRALNDVRRLADELVEAGAGVPCTALARRLVRWGLGPAEFLAGIPGTLGGALRMNAGAFGGETWDHVVSVDVIDRSGRISTRERGDYQAAYREVSAPEHEWFVAARLRFSAGPGDAAGRMQALLAERQQRQPLGQPSCGSVFRNPPGDHAARLIEAAGLKGLRIGAAEVSPKHANFIINTGGATAADIETLIWTVRDRVRERFGVSLEPEVRIVGEPGTGETGR